ncbi:hypothetical protein MY8738_006071 [Beauveria namnaoensis]
MDLFAKTVKNGIAKGYAIGQQQLQQHLAKQRDNNVQYGRDETSGYYGAQPSSSSNTASYSSPSQQQYQQYQHQHQHQHQQQYAAAYSYNGAPPPLPPRQYPPPQPQPNYLVQQASPNLPVNPENITPTRPDFSYCAVLPPPPPSYMPPASDEAAYPQHTPPLAFNGPNTRAYDDKSANGNERMQLHQVLSHDASVSNQPVRTNLAPVAEDFQGREPAYVRDGMGGYVLRNSSEHESLVRNQRCQESVSYDAPPTVVRPCTRAQLEPQREHTTASQPPTTEGQQTNQVVEKTEMAQEKSPEYLTPLSVEQQMSNLALGAAPELPKAESRVQKPKKRRELPPILADGPGEEVVRFCPEHRLVDYPLYWYYLKGLPNSPICTRCYADYIESTPLAENFEQKLADIDTVSSCHFRYPRIQNVIWPAALKTHSIDGLKVFLSSRLLVPNCKGRTTTTGADGVKYYSMKKDDIPGFIACEACFEDCIADTAFAPQFEPCAKVQGKEDRWICDVSILHVKKALAFFSKRSDWRGFVESASRRFKLPACDGTELARGDSGNWYTTRQKMDNFQVCEACYMDKVELDVFGDEFEQMPGPADFDMYIAFLRQRWTCSLTSSSLPMMFALDAAEQQKDFAVFYKAATAIAKLVPCTKYGIIRGNWWTVSGGCQDFDLCEACYEGIMKPNGLDKFLESKQRGPEETVICNFCPVAPRYNEYLNKFAESLDRGVFSCYADHIRTFAAVPACPGRDSLAKSKWWGYSEALFCEECYLVFVKHTRLGGHLPLQGVHDERAQICQMWSPRMRTMWRAVCDAGAPGSAESEAEQVAFRAFGTKRLEVWLQTVPRMQFLRHVKDMKMLQAMQQGQLSLMYQGMNSMAVLSGTDDGNMHGNSSIGWYETENGATGAQMFNNMQTGMADAARADGWMEIFQLELLWKEVE